MTEWFLPALCGLLTGILSSWGIGGGTLLLLCMTLLFGVEQQTAQAINLLYFLRRRAFLSSPTGKTAFSITKRCVRPCRSARSAPSARRC